MSLSVDIEYEVALALFCVLALVNMKEVYHTWKAGQLNPSMAAESSGLAARKWFLMFLLLGITTRSLSLITSIVEGYSVRGDLGDFAHHFPSLVFFTTFSLIPLFWAQLYYTSVSNPYPYLRPTFYGWNVVVYSCFCVFAVVNAKYCSLVVAWAYLKGSIGFLYFGVKGGIELRRKAQVLVAKKLQMLKRVLVIAVVCTTIFLVRGVYLAVLTFSLRDKWEDHSKLYARVNLAIFVLLEFLPCAFILQLVRRRSLSRKSVLKPLYTDGGDLPSATDDYRAMGAAVPGDEYHVVM